jgi:hypothetical protein
MICPQCKAEYRQGFTRCADCEVDLVEALAGAEAADARALSNGGLVTLWAGEDLALHAALLEELESTSIPFFNKPVGTYDGAERGNLFFLSQPRFGFEIKVLSSDFQVARRILEGLAGPPD